MSTELLIFDCDGVLVDSEPIGVRIARRFLADSGLRMSEEEIIDRFVGRSPEVMKKVIEGHLGEGLSEDWEVLYHEARRNAFSNELTLVDGARDALEPIALRTCIASSSSHESLRFKLGLTGLLERFEGRIFSENDVPNGKPAPDLFIYAAAQMGVASSACVVVEDSVFGVDAARAAGMDVFAYSGGLICGSALEGDRTVVFGGMRELPALLRAHAAARGAAN